MNASVVPAMSPMLLRLTAWKIPSGSATAIATTSELAERKALSGALEAKSELTLWLSLYDQPRLPWMRLFRYVPNCWYHGWSKPWSWFHALIAAGLALGPRTV